MLSQSNSPIRVASYNIRKSVGLDWVRNPERIIQVVCELDCDIIAIQEIDKRFGKRSGTLPAIDLLEKHGYHIATGKFENPENPWHGQGWHGNGILFRDNVKLLNCEAIELPTLEPRGAVSAKFELENGLKLRMVATHLSLAGYMRRRQMLTLMKHANDAWDNCPTVIAGDFNEWMANGKAVRELTQDFQLVTPGASFHSSRPLLPLDRFVVSRDLQPISSHVHKSELAKRASDHLPILVSLMPVDMQKQSENKQEQAQ